VPVGHLRRRALSRSDSESVCARRTSFAVMTNPLDMSGHAVIVTGGCRGIGRGITVRFLEHGADVVSCRGTPQPRQVGHVRDELGLRATERSRDARFGRPPRAYRVAANTSSEEVVRPIVRPLHWMLSLQSSPTEAGSCEGDGGPGRRAGGVSLCDPDHLLTLPRWDREFVPGASHYPAPNTFCGWIGGPMAVDPISGVPHPHRAIRVHTIVPEGNQQVTVIGRPVAQEASLGFP
jgi:hypothetical protein